MFVIFIYCYRIFRRKRSEINQCQIMLKDILKVKPKGAPEIKAPKYALFG